MKFFLLVLRCFGRSVLYSSDKTPRMSSSNTVNALSRPDKFSSQVDSQWRRYNVIYAYNYNICSCVTIAPLFLSAYLCVMVPFNAFFVRILAILSYILPKWRSSKLINSIHQHGFKTIPAPPIPAILPVQTPQQVHRMHVHSKTMVLVMYATVGAAKAIIGTGCTRSRNI